MHRVRLAGFLASNSPMDFKVSTAPIEQDGLLVSVEGEFDLSSADQVQTAAEPAISAGRPLLLDLRDCSFIDSTALRLVLQIHGALTRDAGPDAPMAVVANSEIRKFFSMTAIDQSVCVCTTREEALAALTATPDAENGKPASPPDLLARSGEE
ncbi:MAG TPA: STAS domain-containing protein [Solirubrobacterales bacterium]|nr:STAS domain-containing protein [Solirubrobacterales bacterium]